MRKTLILLAALLAPCSITPAAAAWHEAKSKHFIIYSDDNPRNLEQFAIRLEKFDQAMRRVIHADDPPLGDGNRLTIFVLPSESAVEKMVGRKSVGGFYTPRASGSLAFVPRRAGSFYDNSWDQEIIFLHEYAHHLMFQNISRPYPEWMVEGFAEFASTAQFNKDGSVVIGGPAQHRAYSLARGKWKPLPVLFAGDYSKFSAEDREATVYARGWLLTHYLVFDRARAGQTTKYVQALADDLAPLKAAEQSFGDLKQLDRDLSAYLRKITGSIMAMTISSDRVQPGPIEIRKMSAGAAAVMPVRQRSKLGVDKNTAEPLAVEVRKVNARFPGDELVLVTLAEAEFDSGHPEASEAAADAALKINPQNSEAMIYKGRALQRRAEEADEPQRAALFSAARKAYIAANKIDPEDPEALLLFYREYPAEGRAPTPNAIEALHYASDLVPQDLGLRMNSGMQYVRDGDLKAARQTIALVAYSPHSGKLAEVARAVLAKIDAGDAKGAIAAEIAAYSK